MSWNDIKARIRDSYETCRDYVVEHPVKTAVVILSLGFTGYGVYKFFTVPRMQVATIESHREAVHHIASAVTEASETAAETAARGYQWHETSHYVQGHLRHLHDGRVIQVSPYNKMTGGKV